MRCVARKARFVPPPHRLVRLTGWDPSLVEAAYKELLSGGYLTSQWLERDYLEGRKTYIPLRGLRYLSDLKLDPDLQLLYFRSSAHLCSDGIFRLRTEDLADVVGVPAPAIRGMFATMRRVGAMRQTAVATYLQK